MQGCLTRQINSDWQKPLRFALRLMPAGYLRRYKLTKMKEITNRSALFIFPKKPFKEWAKLYNESPIDDLDQRLSEKHVYLLEWFHEEDIVDVLKPYYIEIFEFELLSWNSYKNEWPQNRSIELFLEWFDVKLCDYLYDLETEEIMSEKL
jgi:hypothetical protein